MFLLCNAACLCWLAFLCTPPNGIIAAAAAASVCFSPRPADSSNQIEHQRRLAVTGPFSFSFFFLKKYGKINDNFLKVDINKTEEISNTTGVKDFLQFFTLVWKYIVKLCMMNYEFWDGNLCYSTSEWSPTCHKTVAIIHLSSNPHTQHWTKLHKYSSVPQFQYRGGSNFGFLLTPPLTPTSHVIWKRKLRAGTDSRQHVFALHSLTLNL